MSQFALFALFSLGVLHSAVHARSKPPTERRTGVSAIPQCISVVHGKCIPPLHGQFALNVVRTSDLQEICGVATQARNCVRRELSVECSAQDVEDLESRGVMRVLREYRAAIDYVCDEHLDVFNRNKECLFRGSEYQLDLSPALQSCVQTQTEMCFEPEVTSCFSRAVTEQCGEEIGSHIAQLGSRVREACQQSARTWKTNLFDLMRNSLWF